MRQSIWRCIGQHQGMQGKEVGICQLHWEEHKWEDVES